MIPIKAMNVRTSKQGKATITIQFGIHSKEELSRLTTKIMAIESIIDIERTQG